MQTLKTFTPELKLSEDGGLPTRIHVLPKGRFGTTKYGEIDFSKKVLDDMVTNFGKIGRKIPINLDHAPLGDTRAAGWVEAVFSESKGLYAEVEWTRMGKDLLENKEYRMLSAEVTHDYVDFEDGKDGFGAALLGIALTNYPVMKSIGTILSSKETKGLTKDQQFHILLNNLMNTEEILKKPVADRTTEELEYLAEQFETLTDEQKKQLTDEKAENETEDESETEDETDEEDEAEDETEDEEVNLSQTEIKSMAKELAQLKADKRKMELTSRIQKLAKGDEGAKVFTKQVNAIVKFSSKLNDTQIDELFSILESLPAVKLTGRVTQPKNSETEGLTNVEKFNKLVDKEMTENKLSRKDAMDKVNNAHPELANITE